MTQDNNKSKYEIPDNFMGKPIKGSIDKITENDFKGSQLEIPKRETVDLDMKDFIFVPSMNLYFTNQNTPFEKNWYESHEILQRNGLRMPTLPEFVEFANYLKYSKDPNHPSIHGYIYPWEGVHIDAYFRSQWWDILQIRKLVNYNHILISNGKLIPQKSALLDGDTLMREGRIDVIDDWFLNNSRQGLPKWCTKKGGKFYYRPPESGGVAQFTTPDKYGYFDLRCNCDPHKRKSGIGTFGVKPGN